MVVQKLTGCAGWCPVFLSCRLHCEWLRLDQLQKSVEQCSPKRYVKGWDAADMPVSVCVVCGSESSGVRSVLYIWRASCVFHGEEKRERGGRDQV